MIINTIPRIKAVCKKCKDYNPNRTMYCDYYGYINITKSAVLWNGYRSEITPICPHYVEHSIVIKPKPQIKTKTIVHQRRFAIEPPMAKHEKRISEGNFWRIVKLLEWSDAKEFKTHAKEHYNTKREWLKKTYCVTVLKALRAMTTQKSMHLRRIWHQWELEHHMSFNCGDDGFGDLAYHVIGLGKESYLEHLRYPKLAWQRSNDYKYVECFSYCFPIFGRFRKKKKI